MIMMVDLLCEEGDYSPEERLVLATIAKLQADSVRSLNEINKHRRRLVEDD
jgi:hypothetical protein